MSQTPLNKTGGSKQSDDKSNGEVGDVQAEVLSAGIKDIGTKSAGVKVTKDTRGARGTKGTKSTESVKGTKGAGDIKSTKNANGTKSDKYIKCAKDSAAKKELIMKELEIIGFAALDESVVKSTDKLRALIEMARISGLYKMKTEVDKDFLTELRKIFQEVKADEAISKSFEDDV